MIRTLRRHARRIVRGRPPPSDAQLVAASGLFDAAWYRGNAPELAHEPDPLAHYLAHGAARGFRPSPGFDPKLYLAANPDVAAMGADPLLHYIRFGRAESRAAPVPAQYEQALRVAASELFDAEWYLARQNPPVRGMTAAEHYLSGDADAPPGPLFDAAWYRAAYPMTALHNPLLHWTAWGRAQGRETRNLGQAAGDRTFAVSVPAMPKPPGRVAVVVHAFYPELFGEIWARLVRLPGPFTLLVGVPDATGQALVTGAVAGVRGDVTLDCRVVPNRGRNFGTLFAQFSAEVLRHDFVLHLHTKKSLYTGAEQGAWRNLLIDGLVGTPALAGIVYALFENPEIGLFYPEISPRMPYWAHHWLSSASEGRALMHRLGIEDCPRHGYFDFPVGGMFWARVDAIRPLLETGLAYDDFQPEAAQTDGTLAHAIERAVGLVARARRFRFVAYERATGVFRDDWSPRNLDQYRANSAAAFAGMLDGVDLVSFDIFDTAIIRRALDADSVLRYVGHRLGLRFPAGHEFFVRRKDAERAARAVRGFAGDVDLDEIYAAFPATQDWSPHRIAEAATLERETDAAALCVRPDMRGLIDAARAAGKRVMAISDTYYTGPDIDAILAPENLGGAFDAIHLSSAERARKDRGDLWDRMIEREAVPRERWLHVGDNEQSDVQAACDRGLKHLHVMHPARLLEQFGYRRGPASWAADLVMGPAMRALAGSPFMDGAPFEPRPIGDARDVGYAAFGPLMFLFVAWLVKHPGVGAVDRLHFLSREGLFLLRLYELARARAPALDLPPGSYFHISRRTALSARQATGWAPELILDAATFNGSLEALLRHRIGLQLPPDPAHERTLRLPEDRDDALAALDRLREPIMRHARAEHAGLIAYAREQAMTDGRSGLVDIGYSATVQSCLQDILGFPLTGFYVGTSDRAARVEDCGGRAFACLTGREHTPALHRSMLLEAFLIAPHGQVMTYRAEGGRMVPILKQPTMDARDAAILERMQQGALAYCEELLDIYGPDLLLADIDPSEPQEPFRMLADGELPVPTEIAAMMRVEDDFCGHGDVTIVLGRAV